MFDNNRSDKTNGANMTTCFILVFHIFVTAVVLFASMTYYSMRFIGYIQDKRKSIEQKSDAGENVTNIHWTIVNIETQRHLSKLAHSGTLDPLLPPIVNHGHM